MYKWHVFLGGIASATILLAGAATPALAQQASGSPLNSVTQTSQLTGELCDLAGLPAAAEVNSAIAAVTGQSCPAPDNSAQQSNTLAGLTTMSSALPGLSAVTGAVPGLGSMSSMLPDLNGTTSQVPGLGSGPAGLVTSGTPASDAPVPGLGSNQGSTGTSGAQGALTGVTGTLPVSSPTGGLPDLGSVTGTLSGLTGAKG